jgi:hypothetical protein
MDEMKSKKQRAKPSAFLVILFPRKLRFTFLSIP